MSEDDGERALSPEIWPALANKLWHATHIDVAQRIVADGEIKPNAPPKYLRGYCRSQGGISLFDFRPGPEKARQVLHCGWERWLGGHHGDNEDAIGVWFEVDANRATPHISEDTIYSHYMDNRRSYDDRPPPFRDPMPRCEACHLGSIPIGAVKGALLIDGKRLAEHEWVAVDDNLAANISDFRTRVLAKPPLPLTFGDKLRLARIHAQGKIH